MTEGDTARLTLVNEIGRGMVSLHTHGVDYTITSDGTLKMTNKVADQGAKPQKSYTYTWTAGMEHEDHGLGMIIHLERVHLE